MFRKAKFDLLLSPFQIKQVKLKNRIVQPPQGLGGCGKDGEVTELMLAYYEARAKGGVGLSTVETCCFEYPIGASGFPRLRIDDDRFLPGLSKLTKLMHSYGTPVFLELSHAGPNHQQQVTGLQPLAASSLSPEEHPMASWAPPRGLTITEIQDLVDKWVKGAERAQKAGFDGVLLHFGHTHLINSFLSCAWNKRQDHYGCQDLKSRARLAVEIVQATKKRVGPDFPLGIRLNGREWGMEKGITVEESKAFAKMLEEAGADYLEPSSWGAGRWSFVLFPEQMLYPEPVESPVPLAKKVRRPGLHVMAAEEIKKVVSIPIVGMGRMGPELGEWLLRKGKVDLIALGRRLMADPEIPNKLASGRLEDIAPCTACLECWGSLELIHEHEELVSCRINAMLGRERECDIKGSKKRKRVLVVGGGPAGMEAARVAALRGHEVLLYEREHKLGGLIPLAALIKGTEIEDLPAIVRYLKTQIAKLGVKISLGEEVNLQVIDEIKPDVVILATGGIPVSPEIPGINSKKVIKVRCLHSMAKSCLKFFGPKFTRWLTNLWMPVGKKVVILGGTIIGCELAEFMVKRGRKVTIVETSDKLGTEMVEQTSVILLDWLRKKGVTLLTGVKYEEITDRGLTIITKEGEKQTIEADSILPALFFAPNHEFFETLEGKVPEVYMAGDCKEPNLILEAIHQGSSIGRAI